MGIESRLKSLPLYWHVQHLWLPYVLARVWIHFIILFSVPVQACDRKQDGYILYHNNATQETQGLFFTVLLGLYFTALQAYEYFEASFTIEDSAYGSTFFCSNRISRTTRNYWNNIPNYVSTTTHNITLHIRSPLRI